MKKEWVNEEYIIKTFCCVCGGVLLPTTMVLSGQQRHFTSCVFVTYHISTLILPHQRMATNYVYSMTLFRKLEYIYCSLILYASLTISITLPASWISSIIVPASLSKHGVISKGQRSPPHSITQKLIQSRIQKKKLSADEQKCV